nr:hypothetical protein [uncultured Capnocytophaga sp.]
MKQILFLSLFSLLLSCKTHKIKQTETLQMREQLDSLYQQQHALLHSIEWINSLQEVHLTLESFKDSTGRTQVQLHSTTRLKRLREYTDSLQQNEVLHLRQRTLHFHKHQSFKQKEHKFELSPNNYWLIVLVLVAIAYYQYKKRILKK